jgi:hypothetical protein
MQKYSVLASHYLEAGQLFQNHQWHSLSNTTWCYWRSFSKYACMSMKYYSLMIKNRSLDVGIL